jgi:hypothetical protein
METRTAVYGVLKPRITTIALVLTWVGFCRVELGFPVG